MKREYKGTINIVSPLSVSNDASFHAATGMFIDEFIKEVQNDTTGKWDFLYEEKPEVPA